MLIAKVEGFHLWSKSDAHNTGELINTSLHALQSFPVSVEVQLLGSICDDRPPASREPKRLHCHESHSKA